MAATAANGAEGTSSAADLGRSGSLEAPQANRVVLGPLHLQAAVQALQAAAVLQAMLALQALDAMRALQALRTLQATAPHLL